MNYLQVYDELNQARVVQGRTSRSSVQIDRGCKEDQSFLSENDDAASWQSEGDYVYSD